MEPRERAKGGEGGALFVNARQLPTYRGEVVLLGYRVIPVLRGRFGERATVYWSFTSFTPKNSKSCIQIIYLIS